MNDIINHMIEGDTLYGSKALVDFLTVTVFAVLVFLISVYVLPYTRR